MFSVNTAQMSRFKAALSALPAPATVLDVGCGACHTRDILHALWQDATLIGVDADPTELPRQPLLQTMILCADVCALPFCDPFDMVLCRHPDLDRHRTVWAAFFQNVRRWARQTVLVTTYTLPEFEALSKWVGKPLAGWQEVGMANLPPAGIDGRDAWVGAWVVA